MPKVYLAGPIAGLTYDDAESWRHMVRGALAPMIQCYSPLRQKHALRDIGKITTSEYGASVKPLATDRGIMTRDHNDCLTCDMIFCNLLGAVKPSLGTTMEIAWAFSYRKPLVVVMEPSGNVHDHPMIREAIGCRVASLSDAIDITRAILLPDAAEQAKVPADRYGAHGHNLPMALAQCERCGSRSRGYDCGVMGCPQP